jgi:anti-sigma factor RsiW
MFNQHVTAKLSAYCNGELDKQESQRVAKHLLSCPKCREEYDEIKLGVQFATRLPQLSAPDSLWSEIENLLDAQAAKPLPETSRSGFAFLFSWQRLAFASAIALMVCALGAVVYRTYFSKPQESIVAVDPDAPDFQKLPEVVPTIPQRRPVEPAVPIAPEVATVEKKNNKKGTSNSGNSTAVTNSTTWEVARLAGAPLVGDAPLADKGKIAVGEWLETDGASRNRPR